MKMREKMAKEKYQESMISYQSTLQHFIESNNTRESSDKEKLFSYESDLRKHKSLLECLETLEYKYLEAMSVIDNFQKVCYTLIAYFYFLLRNVCLEWRRVDHTTHKIGKRTIIFKSFLWFFSKAYRE